MLDIEEQGFEIAVHPSKCAEFSPTHQAIWTRAGDDLSILELMQSEKSAWHNGLTQLKNGGGGKEISFMSLLSGMLEDFPNNTVLQEIARATA